MNIEQLLTDAVVKAVKACYGADITPEQVQIQKTRPDFEGHLTVVTFPFLRISKRKPEDTGEDLALWLVENTDLVSTFNIVKGFLNLTIAPKSGSNSSRTSTPISVTASPRPVKRVPSPWSNTPRPTPTNLSTSVTFATTCSDGRCLKSQKPTAAVS